MKGETKGIVFWNKNHREKDKLVKIFTEKYGPLVFFARDIQKNHLLIPYIQPAMCATFIGDFREEGLSFLNDAKNQIPHDLIQTDFSVNAYAIYALQLAEAASNEHERDLALFDFTRKILSLLNLDYDKEILLNIYEIQLLERFGVALDFGKCTLCNVQTTLLDYSFEQHTMICNKHFANVKHRAHLNPQVIGLLKIFQAIPYEKIGKISVKEANKKQLRQFIDALYETYVGLSLNGKKYIEQMNRMEQLLEKQEIEEKS